MAKVLAAVLLLGCLACSGGGGGTYPDGGSGSVAPEADGGTVAQQPPPETDGGTAAQPPPEIDTYKELIAVDSALMNSPRASNASDGPWSFRFLMEQLSPKNPGAFTEAWLKTFRQPAVAGISVADRGGVQSLLSSWPRAADGSLDLSRAPFRLLAIVNRLDLARGEGRLVFGLVDSKGQPARMTVGFEFALPALGTANDAQAWAARWHALAAAPDHGAALESLTRSFTQGGALSQLRTNEAQFGDGWEQRQWVLGSGALQPVPVPSTPAQSANDTAALANFVHDNAAAILSGSIALPAALQGGAAVEGEAWTFRDQPQAQVDDATRHAFAALTCNGCHSSETQSAQGFFHVDPLVKVAGDGRDRLSSFLKDSQLPQRAANLASLLQGGPLVPASVPPLPAKAGAVKYDAFEIPDDGSSVPIAIDASGRVLANSASGPWIWNGSSRAQVTGADFTATGFDAAGDVTGYTGEGGSRRAAVVSGGVRRDLGSLGGLSLANGIGAGGIAGDSVTAAGDYHGFVLANGSLRDLGTLGGSETMTSAINAEGQVTGESQLADGTRHAFLFDGSKMRDLGTLGGDFTLGQAVNARGQVAGMSEVVPGDHRIHAFFHDGTAMHDLGVPLPGLPWISAPGLNDQGTVVGNAYNKPDDGSLNYDTYSYVYSNGVMTNLNELVPPGTALLRTTLGINNQGQILCSDGQAGHVAHAWLLTPR